MKKLTIAIAALAVLPLFTSCDQVKGLISKFANETDSVVADTTAIVEDAGEDELIDSPYYLGEEEPVYETEVDADALKSELSAIVRKFHKNTLNAEPILPLMTNDFARVLRKAQSDTGNDGIRGYTRYAFIGSFFSTDTDILSYTERFGEMEVMSEAYATLKCNITFRVQGPDGIRNSTYFDTFYFERYQGEWKIDEIERGFEEGPSAQLKEQYRQYPPFIP